MASQTQDDAEAGVFLTPLNEQGEILIKERSLQDGRKNVDSSQGNESLVRNPGKRLDFRQLGFTFPPSGFVSRVVTRGLICLVGWTALWSVLKHQLVLPGGNIFGIFTVVVVASFVRVSRPSFSVPQVTSSPRHVSGWLSTEELAIAFELCSLHRAKLVGLAKECGTCCNSSSFRSRT